MDADELAGQNGSLKITIHIGKNDQVEEAFFENYLLQATVTMDMDKCSRLQAAGATVGNVGGFQAAGVQYYGGTGKRYCNYGGCAGFHHGSHQLSGCAHVL